MTQLEVEAGTVALLLLLGGWFVLGGWFLRYGRFPAPRLDSRPTASSEVEGKQASVHSIPQAKADDYPIPKDEAERLRLLLSLDILDSAAEIAFDNITDWGRHYFEAPICVITLVDSNRQWFKSCYGIDGVTETNRDVAFCAYAIMPGAPEVLEVCDAAADGRFANNPLVTGAPFIRYYAGAPLIVEGQKLGTLCIIDTVPRPPMADNMRKALIALSAMVSDQMAARQHAKQLQGMYDELEQFKQMTDQVPAMVYAYTSDEKNENPRFPIVSKGAQTVFGIAPEDIVKDASKLIGLIHPDDIAGFVASVQRSWESLEQWDWKGRFKNVHFSSVFDGLPSDAAPDASNYSNSFSTSSSTSHHGCSFTRNLRSEYKWMRCSSQPHRMPNGHTVWYGAVFDIQDAVLLEESKAELSSLVRSANAPIFQLDPRGIVAMCNPSFLSTLGMKREAVIGLELAELVPSESRPAVASMLDAALLGQSVEGLDLHLSTSGGNRVEIILNATVRKDKSGRVLGVVGVGQDVTQVRRQKAEAENLIREKDTVADKYARALDNLTDVVFEVSAASWDSKDWRVGEHSASFLQLFPTDDAPLLDFVQEPEAMLHLLQSARDANFAHCEMGVVREGSSRILTVDFQAVNITTSNGRPCVLVVCHDLTDFRFRIEVEKDRQVAAKLQHEDKNTHKAQEVGAHFAIEQLSIIETQLVATRDAADRFESPELRQVWMDLASVHEHSFAAIKQAQGTLGTLERRSQRAQEESHTRIMMYQLVADEYVAALTPTDVVAKLEEELGDAADVRLRSFDVPEVQTDWQLLAYGLENALSNARKYGLRTEPIEFALEYREPTLTVVVINAADPRQQAVLIATHGSDATKLLLRRVEGGSKQSTNLGGHALRDVARLMHGRVSLQLLPTSTRLVLEVRAPRHEDVQVQTAPLVYFIDDEPTMRMVYASWIQSPSPLHPDSKVFPRSGLSPAEADDAMRSFANEVIGASPQPTVCVVDQNLRSQVSRRSNVTTGTEITRALRDRGYRGSIVIRSANVSTRSLQEYLAAGADAAMTKDEPRERLLRLDVSAPGAASSPRPSSENQSSRSDGSGFASRRDSEVDMARAVEDAKLVDEHVARPMGRLLLGTGIEACRSEIAAIRVAVNNHDSTHLLLHNLCGLAEAVGAAKLARRCAQLKQRGDAFRRTSSLVGEVDGLESLFAMTEKELLKGFEADADAAAEAQSPPSSSQLFVACIDDSSFSRQWLQSLLFPALRADASRSLALGQTREEQLGFIDFALGRIDAQLRPLPPPHRAADVVIVDQNILLDGMPHMYGSVIVEQLRASGYGGVACIITGDLKDARRLGAVPGVHLTVPKSVGVRHLAKELWELAASPLIDMSHFMGLPMSSIQKLFLIAYHPSGPGSLAQSLKELQAIFLAGENVAHQSHTLLGASRTAGANVLAQELKAFKRDPTAAALEAMWITLDATRERMSVEGHLPPDAFEAKSA